MKMTLNPTAAIIVIGNEILSGRTQDVNINYIAKKLTSTGIKLVEIRVIPDDRHMIIKTVNELRTAFDYVFTTGGIGPTHDDITSESIAEAFGVSNPVHPETDQLLKAHIGNERYNESHRKMAHLPLGAKPIPNPISIAPGYVINNVYVMAGVPQIMRVMFDHILPTLQHGKPILSKSWYAFHASEGKIAQDLEKIQQKFPHLDIGSYPFYKNENEKGITLVVKGQDQNAIKQAAEQIHDLLIHMGYDPHEGEFC